ncbi:MAG: phasin family protein [Candidatus Latescibacterota bacterium]
MLEAMKKAMYAGMGLAFLTGEKIGEMAKELAEAGKLSEREGKELFEDLLSRSEAAGREVRDRIDAGVKEAMGRMNLATRDEVTRLEQQLADLRAEFEALRKENGQD